jgi:hypothetical protein
VTPSTHDFTSTRIRWHRPLLALSLAMALLAVIAAAAW